jgi:hypothetical protein
MSFRVVLRADEPGIGKFGLRMRARGESLGFECPDVHEVTMDKEWAWPFHSGHPFSRGVALAAPPPALPHVRLERERLEREGWRCWSVGLGELHPLCPECAERELGREGPPGRALPERE